HPSAWRMAAGAVAVAALILSHIAAAGVLLGAFSVIVLVLGWSLRRKGFAPLISGTVLLAAGVGLSAYFWIPFLAGLHDAHIDRFVDPPLWRTHIIEPLQLLWSKWGYGLSVAGPADEMSFDVGPAHLVLAIAGLIVLWRTKGGTRKTLGLAFAA